MSALRPAQPVPVQTTANALSLKDARALLSSLLQRIINVDDSALTEEMAARLVALRQGVVVGFQNQQL